MDRNTRRIGLRVAGVALAGVWTTSCAVKEYKVIDHSPYASDAGGGGAADVPTSESGGSDDATGGAPGAGGTGTGGAAGEPAGGATASGGAAQTGGVGAGGEPAGGAPGAGGETVAGSSGTGGVQAGSGGVAGVLAGGTAGVAGSAGTSGTAGSAGTAGAAGQGGSLAVGGTVGTGGAGTGGEGTGGACADTLCGSECVDLSTAVNHCGACGHSCSLDNASTTECQAGVCRPICSGSYLDCSTPTTGSSDDGCETNRFDPNTCGADCGSLVLCNGSGSSGARARRSIKHWVPERSSGVLPPHLGASEPRVVRNAPPALPILRRVRRISDCAGAGRGLDADDTTLAHELWQAASAPRPLQPLRDGDALASSHEDELLRELSPHR